MTLVLVYLSFIISMDVIEGTARGGKKRKPNFREDEILCLIEGISNEKVVIMTKLQSSLTNKKKKEVWREITAKVNAFGVALRTEDDIKKKWKDLKSTVLNSVRDQKKTGCGPPNRPPPYADIIMNIIGERTDMATGIDGELLSHLYSKTTYLIIVLCFQVSR